MSLITLGDLTPYEPWDDRGQAEYIEKTYPPNKKPWFPFSWKKDGVLLGPWVFKHANVSTKGFDPYAGQEWKLKTKYLEIRLCDLITVVASIKIFGFEKEWREYEWKKMPWFCRKFNKWLEYRLDWYQYNEYTEDPYESYYGREE